MPSFHKSFLPPIYISFNIVSLFCWFIQLLLSYFLSYSFLYLSFLTVLLIFFISHSILFWLVNFCLVFIFSWFISRPFVTRPNICEKIMEKRWNTNEIPISWLVLRKRLSFVLWLASSWERKTDGERRVSGRWKRKERRWCYGGGGGRAVRRGRKEKIGIKGHKINWGAENWKKKEKLVGWWVLEFLLRTDESDRLCVGQC